MGGLHRAGCAAGGALCGQPPGGVAVLSAQREGVRDEHRGGAGHRVRGHRPGSHRPVQPDRPGEHREQRHRPAGGLWPLHPHLRAAGLAHRGDGPDQRHPGRLPDRGLGAHLRQQLCPGHHGEHRRLGEPSGQQQRAGRGGLSGGAAPHLLRGRLAPLPGGSEHPGALRPGGAVRLEGGLYLPVGGRAQRRGAAARPGGLQHVRRALQQHRPQLGGLPHVQLVPDAGGGEVLQRGRL